MSDERPLSVGDIVTRDREQEGLLRVTHLYDGDEIVVQTIPGRDCEDPPYAFDLLAQDVELVERATDSI